MQQGGITSTGSTPFLQRLMQFAWQRNTLLQDAAANLDTPGYKPLDVRPEAFQAAMKAARSRQMGEGTPVVRGSGIFADTRDIAFEAGNIQLRPEAIHENLLFHDDNDRNLERVMQNVAENVLTFRLASELFRREHDLLRSAIRERP
jgi:flagellar basal-body rod protein FlgB